MEKLNTSRNFLKSSVGVDPNSTSELLAKIPPELLLTIFSLLDPPELCVLPLVCKAFGNFGDDDDCWKRHCHRSWKLTEEHTTYKALWMSWIRTHTGRSLKEGKLDWVAKELRTGTDRLTLKFVMIGDENIGKSTLAHRFCSDQWIESTPNLRVPNIVRRKSEIIDSKVIDIEIWDSPDIPGFFELAKGIMMCFDLTNEKSFTNLSNWLKKVEKHAFEAGMVICGLKSDAINLKVVSKPDIELFLRENNFQYFEISNKTGTGVKDAIEELLQQCLVTLDDLNPKYVPTLEVLRHKVRFVYELAKKTIF